MSDILVAFPTKAGSAEQVAAAIADALRQCGNIVDLRRARDREGADPLYQKPGGQRSSRHVATVGPIGHSTCPRWL
jgi:hypothetical protein